MNHQTIAILGSLLAVGSLGTLAACGSLLKSPGSDPAPVSQVEPSAEGSTIAVPAISTTNAMAEGNPGTEKSPFLAVNAVEPVKGCQITILGTSPDRYYPEVCTVRAQSDGTRRIRLHDPLRRLELVLRLDAMPAHSANLPLNSADPMQPAPSEAELSLPTAQHQVHATRIRLGRGGMEFEPSYGLLSIEKQGARHYAELLAEIVPAQAPEASAGLREDAVRLIAHFDWQEG